MSHAHTAPVPEGTKKKNKKKTNNLKTGGWIYINLISIESTRDEISNVAAYM